MGSEGSSLEEYQRYFQCLMLSNLFLSHYFQYHFELYLNIWHNKINKAEFLYRIRQKQPIMQEYYIDRI
ncbi:MAG: hypothetical protein DM484_31025 [Candidatus Methylumidiphilus alinenensis]|uniref:Uncharacterized protein n=1 Tax=Candidatus Methylumidiphilus alinenensis TaxID=2202197 RepID=A0A2W4Q8M7_9GAMM|nr:MAG: hypothetical protein DM484_31025 [Candidatus Methylumidiphilus alinenensis]